MNYLTSLEQEALDSFLALRQFLYDLDRPSKNYKSKYMESMNHIGRMLGKLQNKRFGCPTGLHASVCTCTPVSAGYTKMGRIYREQAQKEKKRVQDKVQKAVKEYFTTLCFIEKEHEIYKNGGILQ